MTTWNDFIPCVINVMQWEGRQELRKLCIFNFYCHNSKSLLFYYYHMDGSKKKGIYSPPPPHQFIGAWKISCKKNLCCGNHIRIGKFFSMFCEWVFLSIDQCNLMQHHFDSNFRIYRYLSAGLPHLINPGSQHSLSL